MIGRFSFAWHGVQTVAELHPDGWRHGLWEVVNMLEAIAPHGDPNALYTAIARLAGENNPSELTPESEVIDAGS
jgi:hypothetical protein